MNEPIFIIVDLFCGAGGTTTGFVQANVEGNSIAKVIACVNHDPIAIKSHWANHPEVKHFEEDIRTLDLSELVILVNFNRALYPSAKLILWASLECTNFSKAKGGQPRDADSRTLADHLERYVKAIDPDYIQIENVVEFMSWGPLAENGKPVSRKNGQDFMRWRGVIKSHGYNDEWRELNSANYGAYTSRNRLFGIFSKPWLPIAFPIATHAKVPSKVSMYGDLKKWKAVKDVLNFEDEGTSIFNRKTPLVNATLERIYAGLVKFIAQGDTSFIAKSFSGRPKGKVIGVNGPAGTVTCFAGQSLVQPEFSIQRNTGNPNAKIVDVGGPTRTLTSTGGNMELISPEFLAGYYGNGDNVSSVENPGPTVTTKDRFALIQPEYFIDKQYGGDRNHQSIEQPAGVIMANDKHALVKAESFILNPSHGGHCTSTDKPSPVVVARQDKAPLYFVQVDKGQVSIPVYDTDSEIMIKIKQFMVAFNLVDIKMRMLRIPELLKIQGFHPAYKLEGNQADQKKFIGNSVVPHVVKAWTEAMAVRLIDNEKINVA